MTLPTNAPALENVADLVERLGGIPLDRICLQPPPGMATETDVLAGLNSPRKRICELIDGVLVEKTMGYTESILASYLIEVLNAFVRKRNLGLVTAPDGTIRLWAGRIRIPDVAFFSWDRLPNRQRPSEPIPTLAPDLAIEILSESNTLSEMLKKRQDYFGVGVQLVWEINPQDRIVHIYSDSETEDAVLSEGNTLTGGNVIPGFELSIGDLFAELKRSG